MGTTGSEAANGIGTLFAHLRDRGPLPRTEAQAMYGARRGEFLRDLDALLESGDAEIVSGPPARIAALHAREATNSGHGAPPLAARRMAAEATPAAPERRAPPPPKGFNADGLNPGAVVKARRMLERAAGGEPVTLAAVSEASSLRVPSVRALAATDIALGIRVAVSTDGVAHPVSWTGVEPRFLAFLSSPGYPGLLKAAVALGGCDGFDLLAASAAVGAGHPGSEAACKVFLARAELLGLVEAAGNAAASAQYRTRPRAERLCSAMGLDLDPVVGPARAAVAEARAEKTCSSARTGVPGRDAWTSTQRTPWRSWANRRALAYARLLEHREEMDAEDRKVVESLGFGSVRRSDPAFRNIRDPLPALGAGVEDYLDSYAP